MKKLFLLLLFFLFCATAHAQGVRIDGVATTRSGFPAAGATIAVCTQPATTTTEPCSPLATLYEDATLTTPCTSGTPLGPNAPGSPCSNPMLSDGLGNYHFYYNPNIVPITEQFYGSSLPNTALPDQGLAGPGSGGGGSTHGYVYIGPGSSYACSDVGMNAAITALGTGGGTVDATACVTAGPIASTVTVGANTAVNSVGVKLILPCTSSSWSVTVTGGAHVFQIADRSELVGCSLRASLITVANTANIADVISFLPNPGNSSITEYGRVSNVWIENDQSAATIVNGLLNLQNSYDGVIRDVKLAGYAPCLFYASDTSSTIAPNANDVENLLLDGIGDAGTQLVCIQSNHSGVIGPIHFRGGDWGHPGSIKNAVIISTPAGTGHSYGMDFSDIYIESNASDTTTPIFSLSQIAGISLNDIFINRLSGSSTAACVSFPNSGDTQTYGISFRNLVCTGGTGNNAILSSVTAVPSFAMSVVPSYFAPGLNGANDLSSLNGINNLTATEIAAPSAVSGSDILYGDSTAHRWKMLNNGGSGFNIPGIATAGTSGHIVTLAANGIDLTDGGALPGGGNVSTSGSPSQYQIALWASGTTIEGAGPGTSGYPFVSNGAGAYGSFQQLASSGLNITSTSCTNQFVRDISGGGVGTCNSIALADTPLTAAGDILYNNAGTLGRLPLVNPGTCLGNSGGNWASFGCSSLAGLTTDGFLYASTSNTVASPAVPTVNGSYACGYTVTGSADLAPTCPLVGLTPRGVGTCGAGDMTLYSDNNNAVLFEVTGTCAESLPVPTGGSSLNNANFFTNYINHSTGIVTVTPVTWTISLNGAAAGASAPIGINQQCTLFVDSIASTQWDLQCAAVTGSSVFPLTVSGTVNSGGIPCFNSTTNEETSAAITAGVLVKGGGAGACVAASSITDNATTVTSTDTGGFVAPVFVSSGTTAGFADYPQGTTSAAVAPCNTATSICVQAPTSVTSYLKTLPGAAPVIASYEQTNGCGSSICTMSFHPVPVVLTVTSDFTDSTSTTLELVTGLSTTMPVSQAVVVKYDCVLYFDQASAAVVDEIGVGITGTAPTYSNHTANVWANASNAWTAGGVLSNLASTTPTSVVSFTPSAITTIWHAELSGTIEQPSNATPGVFGVYVYTTTGTDNLIVKRDSACTVVYQ